MRNIFISVLLIILPLSAKANNTEKATFAGGCFWCMEQPFDELPGVISTTSGFTGGASNQPSYDQVSKGQTGHLEAVEIVYDPTQITYQELLKTFWKNIDPSDPKGQFCDRGNQYRSAIFYHNEQQKLLAEQSKAETEKILGKTIVTPVLPASQFNPAEAYHQDFYKKNALRYKQYKIRCGRDRKLKEIWKADNQS